MSKFFDDIQANKWDYIKPVMDQVVAKKIVERIEGHKEAIRKSGSLQYKRG